MERRRKIGGGWKSRERKRNEKKWKMGEKKAVKKKGNIHIYIYTENALQKGEKWKNN